MKARTGILMLAVLLCISAASLGDTYTITDRMTTDDLYGDTRGDAAGYPANGTATSLYFSNTLNTKWAAIQFDLSHPAGETISSVSSATVRLRIANVGEPTSTLTNVWRLTEQFDETNIRSFAAGEMPLHDTSAVVTFDRVGMSSGDYFTLDVSSLLVKETGRTFGILLQTQSGCSGSPKLYPHEYGSGISAGHLSAGYTTVPEPTTMGLLGLGALALLRRRICG